MKKEEKRKTHTKEELGITLVSLVITIIVLLILAGAAINMAINSEGLFGKANEAVEEWNSAAEDEETQLGNLIEKLDEIGPVDWEKVLADAQANPEKYKHPGQASENGDIGIGTNGKPVDLDLWKYMKYEERNDIK